MVWYGMMAWNEYLGDISIGNDCGFNKISTWGSIVYSWHYLKRLPGDDFGKNIFVGSSFCKDIIRRRINFKFSVHVHCTCSLHLHRLQFKKGPIVFKNGISMHGFCTCKYKT